MYLSNSSSQAAWFSRINCSNCFSTISCCAFSFFMSLAVNFLSSTSGNFYIEK